MPLTPHMPVARVFLLCSSPEDRPERFDTFVTVTEEEYARGEHVDRAVRRANIRGFRGPYHVSEVRRVDRPVVMDLEEIRAQLMRLSTPRLDRLVKTVGEAVQSECASPPNSAVASTPSGGCDSDEGRPPRSRRARSGGRIAQR